MCGNQRSTQKQLSSYYLDSYRATLTKSNPKQATYPMILLAKFGNDSHYTFSLIEWKPSVTPDGGRWEKKAKIICPRPQGVDIIIEEDTWLIQIDVNIEIITVILIFIATVHTMTQATIYMFMGNFVTTCITQIPCNRLI